VATVKSKTSIKIDELINGTVVSGRVDASGHLILTTAGGADIDAGFIAKPFTGPWKSTTAYVSGDVVGYAGQTWAALQNGTGKCPALFTNFWQRMTGGGLDDWVQRDPYFSGASLTADWEFFWKTGTPTVAYTSIAGEFETGYQALKISCPASSLQRMYEKDENVVRGGEVVTLRARARLLTTAAGARLDGTIIQNDAAGDPVPLATGTVNTGSPEGAQALTTSWATYTWTFTCANAKPRAMVNLFATTDASGAAVFLIDRVVITRASIPVLAAWPVGSIFMSILPTDPKELLGGGTWVRWGQGRMPVSQWSTDTDFDTAEETGGSKTNTIAAGHLPPHTHSIAHDHANGSLGIEWASTTTTGGAGIRVVDIQNLTGGGGTNETAVINVPAISNAVLSGSGGFANNPLNNTPMYIVCYMWKRTA
jgi:hypothetical protein